MGKKIEGRASQTKRRTDKSPALSRQRAQDGGQSSPDNNNVQDFRTLNATEPEPAPAGSGPLQLSYDEDADTCGSSGRGGSGCSSDVDENETNSADERGQSSDSLASSSGRSSATNQPADSLGDQVKESGWNFVPQRREAAELIDQVRLRFLDTLDERTAASYDGLDLAELRRPLPGHTSEQLYQSLAVRLIGRFVDFDRLLAASRAGAETNGAELDKALAEACEKLRELLLFRRHHQLSSVRADQFCREIHQLYGIFAFGYDKNHVPVMYLRARVHRRWSAPLDETFKRYVAWQMDLMTKSNHGAQVARSISNECNIKDGSFGICFDCLNVSYACVDMDFLSYLVKILVHYYPTYCRYALCVDLPWLFRSVWKLVRSWLPEEARETVHLISSKQLVDFIDEQQIPNSMKINDLDGGKKSARGKHRMPAGFEELKNFDQFAQELNLHPSEIKQFKAHIEKVLKEYEQLGAI